MEQSQLPPNRIVWICQQCGRKTVEVDWHQDKPYCVECFDIKVGGEE